MRKAFLISFVFHIAVILIISSIPSLRFGKEYHPIMVNLIVLPRGTGETLFPEHKKLTRLPRVTIEQSKKKPGRKTMTAAQKKPVKQKKKLTKEERMIRKALSKIDKDLVKEQYEPETAQVKEEKGGFEEGTGDKPIKVSPDDLVYLQYQAKVRAKISQEWFSMIRSTANENIHITASIEVSINEEGEVTSIRWVDPSGNNSFDASCVRAIKKASPLPKPPDKLAWEAYNEGFLVEFDPSLRDKY
ncbi:MAG: TonB family protein [Pseudomonadota bacterium]